ncbi:MAG: UDP-N-acetylmuramate--L-alanine ligase [Candidatus Pacebacteria bacterium]|nr:UDP-N-acetylmuramate--L-alanine ligase [Candidatus Paceibacterota bacterium]
MNETFLKSIKKAHFIGIGGIGVSAIARLMLARGVSVSGSDRGSSRVTDGLAELGAQITFGHKAENISPDTNVVIYSPAVLDENPELAHARKKGIKAYTYPETLGLISEGMKTIAISGTHGKTTTTAMVAEVLAKATKSPTVIVGSLLQKSGSNFVKGESDLFVVEACEYKRSFLNLSPTILVITNIDNDHLDYYKDIDDIISAFHEIAMKVPKTGFIVADANNKNIKKALRGVKAKIIDYTKIKPRGKFELGVSGDHNIKNAKAVIAVANILKVPISATLSALKGFQGTWRRMELKGKMKSSALLYDDYAHHPTEVKATLQGFRAKFPNKNIRVVFQPHLYSRTKLLLDDFAQAFNDADEVILAPIYAAREELDPTITSEILADRMKAHHKHTGAFDGLPSIEKYINKTAKKGDVVVTMGAGNVYEIAKNILPKRKNKKV